MHKAAYMAIAFPCGPKTRIIWNQGKVSSRFDSESNDGGEMLRRWVPVESCTDASHACTGIIIWRENPHINYLTRHSADVGHLLPLLLRSKNQTWMVDGLRGRCYLTKSPGIFTIPVTNELLYQHMVIGHQVVAGQVSFLFSEAPTSFLNI